MQKIDPLQLSLEIRALFINISLYQQRLKDNCLTHIERGDVETYIKTLESQVTVQQGRCPHPEPINIGEHSTQCPLCGIVKQLVLNTVR